MKRLRTLIAAAARRLSAQHTGKLQQAARWLTGPKPDHPRTQPLSGIVQRQGKARLLEAAGEGRQRPLFFRAHLAEKRQRQMKVIRRDGPAGILREVRCPPLDNLFADGRRQFNRKNSLFGSDMIETR